MGLVWRLFRFPREWSFECIRSFFWSITQPGCSDWPGMDLSAEKGPRWREFEISLVILVDWIWKRITSLQSDLGPSGLDHLKLTSRAQMAFEGERLWKIKIISREFFLSFCWDPSSSRPYVYSWVSLDWTGLDWTMGRGRGRKRRLGKQ